MLNAINNAALKYILAPLCAIAIMGTAPTFADETAESYVTNILTEAEPILAHESEADRFSGISELVDTYVDMRRISLFVLGQHARKISDAQKAEYIPLFKKYATQIYQKTLSGYAGQTLEVINSIDRSERDIIVNSRISNPVPGDPLADNVFHWRIYRNRDGELSVVDAGANNVWLAIEQRSQFTSVISNNGGGEQGMAALIADLKAQTN